MPREPLGRLDYDTDLREQLLPQCRLQPGQVWEDPVQGHRIGVLDATQAEDVHSIMGNRRAVIGIHDPPYNLKLGKRNSPALFTRTVEDYMEFSRKWMQNAIRALDENAHCFIWLGADQKANFQPLPDFMLMMREFPELQSRSFITLRNQRGYGTQNNWMCVRQELLHYTRGKPYFQVTYTDIPKVLKGYYKTVNGRRTENSERGRGQTIRPGNVWIDIQQVFYRMEENVPGAYAQKPLKAIERILASASRPGDLIVDFFAHSGTGLLACERNNRICFTMDNDPLFVELSRRRLERYRNEGKTGWQWSNPF